MSNKRKIWVVILSVIKVIVPIAVCIFVGVMIVSIATTTRQKSIEVENSMVAAQAAGEMTLTSMPEPLKENAYKEVNELMSTYYQALADGNLEVIRNSRDLISDTELIKCEKKSEYIEKYDNITCYTKNGIDDGAYFVYVVYDVKFYGIDTLAPGLNTWYVYPDSTGKLVICGKKSEAVEETLKVLSKQDDVVDIFTKVDVKCREVIASDEKLKTFLEEVEEKINTAVSIALAQLEAASTVEEEQPSTQAETEEDTRESTEPEVKVTQIVNQEVKTTDTVNVRSSDSETADKIGKAHAGMVLTRIEEKLNGWSKVIFEGKEAYIKSDYLEVVTIETNENSIGVVKANSNVNVRSKPDQESERIGVAQSGNVYNLLEEQGEWYKIDYKGK